MVNDMLDRSRGARVAARNILTMALLVVAMQAAAATQAVSSRTSTSQLPVQLDPSITVLVERTEPAAVLLAAEDLANDLEKVFGKRPAVINRTADAAPVTLLIGGPNSELVASLHVASQSEPESFSISTLSAHWAKAAPTHIVLLSGADLRGTIYAVYQFSQEFLGIDPMYYWTDNQPARSTRVELPTSLHKTYPAPVFKYRGFFINDEDLLTGWAPGERKDDTGISLAVWNKIYETILRLKGNMVTPGTWIFPDEPQVTLASRRGLVITQHHAVPLGVNVARWPESVPYSYSEHPEILQRAWKNAVDEYKADQEVLWTLGLRGLSDTSYATTDPNARGDQKLGELITKAIADQMSIVRAVHPQAHFVLNLWQEGSRLKKAGYLKVPSEVTAVWADTGYGYLQDNGEVGKGDGAYYHVAMFNQFANQLTEMVPMERVQAELGRYIAAGATDYLLVNTSDIRPVAMMARAVMDIGWGGVRPGGRAEDVDYYRNWSAKEFGEKAAPQIAKLYSEYFRAPANRPGTQPALPYGDNYYHTQVRRFLLSYMIGAPLYSLPGQNPKWVKPSVSLDYPTYASDQALKGEIERCGAAQPRWDDLWNEAVAAEGLVPAERKPFFEAGVLAMIAINKESNRTLSLIAQAVLDARNGRVAEAQQLAKRALSSLDEIDRAESAAEYGKWKNWYRGDWLTGIYRTRELVQMFLNYLDDPLGHISPPAFWSSWEAYYHIMQYEKDRQVDVH